MNPLTMLLGFFGLIMISVTLGGYLIFYRGKTAAIKIDGNSSHVLQDTLQLMGEALPKRPAKADRYRRKLESAGYRGAHAVQTFVGLKGAFAVVLGLALGVTRLITSPAMTGVALAMLAGVCLGYFVPDRVLQFWISRRAGKIRQGIPTVIDLLVLSLEAGQSLDAALIDTAREIRGEFPELSAELSVAQLEMLASLSRPEVFQALRDRTPEPELKRLSQVFIDSDRYGTSLAPTLRNHVKFLRVRLRQQVQEQARKVGVKLIFPVFFLIFPAVILITLGPAVIMIYAQLGAFASAK